MGPFFGQAIGTGTEPKGTGSDAVPLCVIMGQTGGSIMPSQEKYLIHTERKEKTWMQRKSFRQE